MEQSCLKKNGGGRIEFIDLAKGICILLVISFHADLQHVIYYSPKISGYFGSFRIPLYFILSGLFVSFTAGWKIFLHKKINKLLVPFCFFVFLTNLLMWIGKDLMGGYENGTFAGKFEWFSPIQVAYYELSLENFNNTPLWFLVCLFNAYVLYMCIHYLARKKMWLKGVGALVAGGCGYLTGYLGINIPFHIDTALSAVPFIFMGEIIRKETHLLVRNKYDKWNVLASVILFCIMIFTTPNSYGGHQNFVQYYFNGICGTIGILLLCKQIKYLPVISYIGRYSIIFLCIHQTLVGHVTNVVARYFSNALLTEFVVIITIVCIGLVTTVFMKTYLPWFCAQKDVLFFFDPPQGKLAVSSKSEA